MGAACCRPVQDNETRLKPTSGNRNSSQLQSSRRGRTTSCRSAKRNSSSSSNRDGRSATRRRPQRINAVQTQQQDLAPVTASGSSNQVDEQPHVLQGNNDKTPSSDCKIETLPDALKEPKGSDSLLLLPIIEDDDFCPTCLEGYEEDNPKILTQCKHHYHLACILEWMERSSTCPICDQVMIIEEAAADTAPVSGSEVGQVNT